MDIKLTFNGQEATMPWEKFAREAPQTIHEEEVVLPEIHKQLLNGEKAEWNKAVIEVVAA